jgi:hypothetical protein
MAVETVDFASLTSQLPTGFSSLEDSGWLCDGGHPEADIEELHPCSAISLTLLVSFDCCVNISRLASDQTMTVLFSCYRNPIEGYGRSPDGSKSGRLQVQ